MAFEEVSLGSGGASVEVIPKLKRTQSRQCIACEHRAKLLEQGSGQRSTISDPGVGSRIPTIPSLEMAKSDGEVQEALEDRDPNKLNQHLQVILNIYFSYNFLVICCGKLYYNSLTSILPIWGFVCLYVLL